MPRSQHTGVIFESCILNFSPKWWLKSGIARAYCGRSAFAPVAPWDRAGYGRHAGHQSQPHHLLHAARRRQHGVESRSRRGGPRALPVPAKRQSLAVVNNQRGFAAVKSHSKHHVVALLKRYAFAHCMRVRLGQCLPRAVPWLKHVF